MSEGAEWLAQENKRLAERAEQLEGKLRESQALARKFADEKGRLAERLEALETKYWSVRTTITELADEIRKDD